MYNISFILHLYGQAVVMVIVSPSLKGHWQRPGWYRGPYRQKVTLGLCFSVQPCQTGVGGCTVGFTFTFTSCILCNSGISLSLKCFLLLFAMFWSLFIFHNVVNYLFSYLRLSGSLVRLEIPQKKRNLSFSAHCRHPSRRRQGGQSGP